MKLRGELALAGLTGVMVGVGLWFAGRSYDFTNFRIIGVTIPFYVEAALVAVVVVAARSGAQRLKAGGHAETLRAIRIVAFMLFASVFVGIVKGAQAQVVLLTMAAVAVSTLPLSMWLEAQSRRR